ncbi:mycothiol system anti-sigma-R factor [Nocardioides sp. SYSU D00038]|uniref:mycothiol system anti-sigma-R factor n=1 Tax=Nocardioides sp. SYSU D00038 TaxID=2812554 RepID=UPI00196884BB|nr:mycothiol system anti-sigma-R factor [Nocardioides sp. SYSU D00038]
MSHQHGPDDVSAAECADYLEQIVYFIDNELDAADCAAVREHIDACNPCLEKYDLQRTVKSVVARSCSEKAPEDLRAKVLVQLREVQVRITEA